MTCSIWKHFARLTAPAPWLLGQVKSGQDGAAEEAEKDIEQAAATICPIPVFASAREPSKRNATNMTHSLNAASKRERRKRQEQIGSPMNQ